MSLTFLLDLDDTLLSNNIDTFLPAYIQSLAATAPHIPTKLFISSLLAASEMMVRKNRLSGTLENTFDDHFYPAIGFSKEQMRPTIDHFYQEKYPSLQSLTQPRPVAQTLVTDLASYGHHIVVATNPLFPATAIRQRLNWAGFEDIQQKFNIVTSYENFHFSKPHPEYYAEILAQMAWPDQPAIMIGNSLKDDIIPAESIGMITFYLNDLQPYDSINRHPESSQGGLHNILPWIEKINRAADNTFSLTSSGFINAIKVTPAALETLSKKLKDKNIQKALSLVKNAIEKDLNLLGGNNDQSIIPVNLLSACQSFFESRTRVMDQLSKYPDRFSPEQIFTNDKTLLRAFINLID